jgi:hypothetical protein
LFGSFKTSVEIKERIRYFLNFAHFDFSGYPEP